MLTIRQKPFKFERKKWRTVTRELRGSRRSHYVRLQGI